MHQLWYSWSQQKGVQAEGNYSDWKNSNWGGQSSGAQVGAIGAQVGASGAQGGATGAKACATRAQSEGDESSIAQATSAQSSVKPKPNRRAKLPVKRNLVAIKTAPVLVVSNTQQSIGDSAHSTPPHGTCTAASLGDSAPKPNPTQESVITARRLLMEEGSKLSQITANSASPARVTRSSTTQIEKTN